MPGMPGIPKKSSNLTFISESELCQTPLKPFFGVPHFQTKRGNRGKRGPFL